MSVIPQPLCVEVNEGEWKSKRHLCMNGYDMGKRAIQLISPRLSSIYFDGLITLFQIARDEDLPQLKSVTHEQFLVLFISFNIVKTCEPS